ncbi:MAG: type II toxin-antitoxin system VapC family toxin [Actinomycetales bacterium]|nr:type II toxin-antitoxin system VapC family toxin [Actinomycetales bacterium]
MIVADTSAAVAALLGQSSAREALIGQRLIAPHVIDAEVAHALRGLVRGSKLSADQGRSLLGTWCRLALDRLPMAPLLPRVWELRDNLTAYDAVFVAAAEAHGVPLVTGDRGIATAVGPRCRIELIARPA